MVKVEIGIYFCVTADILTKFYRNVLGEVLYQTYEFCPNRWFLLVTMTTEMLNFRNKYSKILFSEAIKGMKLKLCINVYDISLYINCFFLLLLLLCFRCYGKLKFPYIYNGKREGRPLLLSDYRYFDESLTVMFLEHMNLVQTAEFDYLPWQTIGFYFLHATFTVVWLNIAFIAVHSGERCGRWACGYFWSHTFIRLGLESRIFVE